MVTFDLVMQSVTLKRAQVIQISEDHLAISEASHVSLRGHKEARRHQSIIQEVISGFLKWIVVFQVHPG